MVGSNAWAVYSTSLSLCSKELVCSLKVARQLVFNGPTTVIVNDFTGASSDGWVVRFITHTPNYPSLSAFVWD